jgi:hypothetical protein
VLSASVFIVCPASGVASTCAMERRPALASKSAPPAPLLAASSLLREILALRRNDAID